MRKWLWLFAAVAAVTGPAQAQVRQSEAVYVVQVERNQEWEDAGAFKTSMPTEDGKSTMDTLSRVGAQADMVGGQVVRRTVSVVDKTKTVTETVVWERKEANRTVTLPAWMYSYVTSVLTQIGDERSLEVAKAIQAAAAPAPK